ncbi:MAG: NAD(P)/FAD-dependent oxidoreductase [Nevskia sp.]|nr:NAD(P)/FAD-dependent oxidoreductase [Nevskia sp.]
MTRREPVEHTVEVAIVGAGVSGIGAAIKLLDNDMRDFVVLEKADSLGGTWRDNTYPGCACDVPSHLYSYSFEQKADWTRLFAGQAEILDYVHDTARKYRVEPHIRYGEPVEQAAWDESALRWRVRTAKGVYLARVLVSCTGYLHEPQLPDLPGLQEFPGTLFHSSRWNHAHDLSGERVAVIGSGASAIQFVPEIQPKVASLHLFQRTAHWVLPKADGPIDGLGRGLLRLPYAAKAWRGALYAGFETFGIGFRHPALLKQAERIARAHIRSQVKDPALRAKLTPNYMLGCKRVLLSSQYYPALTQPNVEVLATGVQAVRGRTVIGADGSAREVDSIILGTGFHVTDQPSMEHVHGADGRSLAQVFAGSPEGYRGTTVAGFPNLFIVLGPNIGIGHNSAFIVIEAQLAYIASALRIMRERRLARVEVRREAQADYNRRIQRDLQGTVWNTGGCSSYYLDANGRNSTGFPWSTLEMRRLLARFDADNYHTQTMSESVEHADAA